MTRFDSLYNAAHMAGLDAATAMTPTPMAVQNADIFGNRFGPVSVIADGPCGFAWVAFKGNTAFGRWAKKMGVAKKAYGGGLQIWISDFNQSMERKYAYARAFADTLNEAGIDAYASNRMD